MALPKTGYGSLRHSKSLSNNRLYLYYTVSPTFCQELKNSAPDRAASTDSTHTENFIFTHLSGCIPPRLPSASPPRGREGVAASAAGGSGWAREARGDERSSITIKSSRIVSNPPSASFRLPPRGREGGGRGERKIKKRRALPARISLSLIPPRGREGVAASGTGGSGRGERRIEERCHLTIVTSSSLPPRGCEGGGRGERKIKKRRALPARISLSLIPLGDARGWQQVRPGEWVGARSAWV